MIEILSNLDAVGDLMGSLQGLASGLNQPAYVDGLIKRAHGRAAGAFDLAAVATARTGHLQHVFEFGVPGITPGQPKYEDPTSPAARLYEHTLGGSADTKEIGFAFRPALNRNPRPSTALTGVPSKYIAKLSRRKYVFWNKAYVMESGQTVEIHAKNNDSVFVPFRGPSNNPNNQRGYMMWNTHTNGPLRVTPGRTSKGQFAAFWTNWWSGEGTRLIETDMAEAVQKDIEVAMATAARTANAVSVKPTGQVRMQSTAAKAFERIKKLFKHPERNNTKTL